MTAPDQLIQRGAVGADMSPDDLAELMTVFNEVTGRLQSSHERLNAEVERLRQELGEANDRLQRSRRLAALGEMAAGIAHEVRNPLASISLYARMLEDDLQDRPEQRGVAEKIGRAVRGAEAIVQDVLSFAREISLRPEPIEVSALFTQAMEGSGVECVPGVTVRRDDETRGPMTIVCDRALVRQSLVNLIRNALDAMAEVPGNRVLTLDARAEGRETVLVVADTGPGVPPGVVDRMFNPFFTTRATGTGLGLAIVHRIADAHAGAVGVQTREGGGAVLELRLPTEPGAATRSQPGQGPATGDTSSSTERAA